MTGGSDETKDVRRIYGESKNLAFTISNFYDNLPSISEKDLEQVERLQELTKQLSNKLEIVREDLKVMRKKNDREN
jgi:hypothetical protein